MTGWHRGIKNIPITHDFYARAKSALWAARVRANVLTATDQERSEQEACVLDHLVEAAAWRDMARFSRGGDAGPWMQREVWK